MPRLVVALAVVAGVTTVGLSAAASPGSTALPGNASTCVAAVGASPGDAVLVNMANTEVAGDGWGALRSPDAVPVFQRTLQNQFANVNFAPNTRPNPNVGVVTVGADSTFCYDGAVGASNVILDQLAVIPAASLKVTEPTRVLDTRSSGLVGPNGSVCVAAAGASPGDAAVVNITNTEVVSDGWGALRSPDGVPVFQRPLQRQYANVNFAPNTPPNPNVGVVTVGADSTFCYDGAVGASNVILDQLAVIPAASLKVSEPIRVLDTRSRSRVGPLGWVCLPARGASPGDAVVVNITNTDVVGDGWGALRSADALPVFQRASEEQYANVNFAPNTPSNPNVGVVTVSATSTFCYDGAVGASNVILDQLAVIPAASLKVTEPTRLLDTRPVCSASDGWLVCSGRRSAGSLDRDGSVCTAYDPRTGDCIQWVTPVATAIQ